MRFLARVLTGFLIVLLLLFFAKPSFAQNTISSINTQANFKSLNNINDDVKINLHSWTQIVFMEIGSTVTCQIIGVDPFSPSKKCLGLNTKTGKIGYIESNGGAVGGMTRLITVLYTPPVQPGSYIHYLAQNFGLTKPTYAQGQGVGFNQLHAVMDLWIQFRNIAYMMFVFIFVVVGVAIMLRLRIDPRTVMSLQNQIPKLIIGIVLITFSYAIAGLMVDLMWVATYASVQVIGKADSQFKPSKFYQDMQQSPLPAVHSIYNNPDGTAGGGLLGLAVDGGTAINDTVRMLFSHVAVDPGGDGTKIDPKLIEPRDCSWINAVACWWDTQGGGALINSIFDVVGSIGNLVSDILVGFLSAAIGFIAFLIFSIAILVSLIRLWLNLLKAYIMSLFYVVFAPLFIIGGLIPGFNAGGFNSWFRGLLANLAVFPVIAILFAMGKVFVDNFQGSGGSLGFVPPFIGGAGISNNISPLIALAIIFFSPEAVNMVKKALKAEGPGLKFGGLGAGLAAGAIIGGAAKRRMYWRDSQGGTHGIAANIGRSATRSFTNSRVATRVSDAGGAVGGTVGNVMDKNIVTRSVKNIALVPKRWSSTALSKASNEQYSEATRKGGKSLQQQAEEKAAAERMQGHQELASTLKNVIKPDDQSSSGTSGSSGGTPPPTP